MPLMARLTGQELLEYAQANEGLPLDDLVKGAGYYREIIGEGDEVKVQLNRQPFWKALAVAQGDHLSTCFQAGIPWRRQGP